ncbi:uncharacterized protein B0I36DRAFT_433263 [Microdochium trichocladiopsis]|uniref:Uncharacterized protein n=1 Tax=Microdochium trichocladiopsis TaxID=1682393 RepID=A0A9P8Y2T3_9PEZI|nr:uncharacterized protein B0I36DRAFT_433263 [Microdochium trichocladiopsis]KAH7028172.1 hypothetical protein B0I36DRAFT_433263 [Microdochium trichocladiopsis]
MLCAGAGAGAGAAEKNGKPGAANTRLAGFCRAGVDLANRSCSPFLPRELLEHLALASRSPLRQLSPVAAMPRDGIPASHCIPPASHHILEPAAGSVCSSLRQQPARPLTASTSFLTGHQALPITPRRSQARGWLPSSASHTTITASDASQRPRKNPPIRPISPARIQPPQSAIPPDSLGWPSLHSAFQPSSACHSRTNKSSARVPEPSPGEAGATRSARSTTRATPSVPIRKLITSAATTVGPWSKSNSLNGSCYVAPIYLSVLGIDRSTSPSQLRVDRAAFSASPLDPSRQLWPVLCLCMTENLAACGGPPRTRSWVMDRFPREPSGPGKEEPRHHDPVVSGGSSPGTAAYATGFSGIGGPLSTFTGAT